tara:strand:- start:786 stop:2777 length:1992 start_codon:yes stop_codon:yes gene_type:complete
MKFNPILLCSLLFLSNQLFAQDSESYFNYEDYDWSETEAVFTGEVDDSTAALILKDKLLYNFHYIGEDNKLVMDRLYHRRVYLNSTSALEEFNRKYIPTGEANELLKFRARAITGNKVTEIDEDDIETGLLEDSETEYNYFAFQGLEVGSIVEYYYVNRMYPNTKGLMITYQEEYEILDFQLDVITPWNLIFTNKVYNLPDSVITDTSIENQNRWYLHTATSAYEEESVSPGKALMGRVMFKLDQNLYNGASDITSYNYAAQNLISFITVELSRKGEKAIKQEAKNASKYLVKEEPNLSLAQRLEHYIKDNYSYYDASATQLNDIEFIQENKVFNSGGALRLYTRILDQLELDYQVVYTTNRSQLIFDDEFESNKFLDELLVYIPQEDLYFDISDVSSRNGVNNFNFTANKALFIDKELLGEDFVALTDVREIPYKPASFTVDSIKAKVILDDAFLDNKVNVFRSLTGYAARSYQGIFELIKEEDQLKEIEESLIGYIDSEAEVQDIEVRNGKAIYLGRKPLQATATLTNIQLLENAGNSLLLNVGKLIGPQMTMYDEDSARVNDIYNYFARSYYRTIEFEIPTGYKLLNADDLLFDEKLVIDGETRAIFKSTYQTTGNTVLVTISEWYEDHIYPKEYFEDYLKVVNAAADFNKVSVLLEKES